MNGMDDRNDPKMGGTTDANLCLRMSDRMDDLNLDVSRGLRINVTDDRNDLKMGANLDGMNLHVRLKAYLNKSCDRMSHDHLQCDLQMMRHRDTNRTDAMNLGGKMKIRHVNRRMKDDH
jgi:hypothetical protein